MDITRTQNKAYCHTLRPKSHTTAKSKWDTPQTQINSKITRHYNIFDLIFGV